MPTTNIKNLATTQLVGWNAQGVTIALNGGEDGIDVTGTINGRTVETDGASVDTLSTDRTNGLRGAIIRYPSRTVYAPASDTDAARGTALDAALTAAASGDRIVLARGYTYETSTGFGKSVASLFIDGRGATLKAAASSNLNNLLYLEATTAGSRIIVSDLILDSNGANVTLSSGTGISLQLDGAGEIYANGITAKDGGNASTTAHFYTKGAGVKSLANCVAINPGHVSYRLLAATSRLTNCDHICTASLQDGRIAECDSQATTTQIKSIVWNGGLWKETATKKININWDPSNNGSYTADEIILDNITMDFGTGHQNDADSFMKFDNVEHVLISNCTQRHSNVGSTFTTFKEDFLNFDSVRLAEVINCRFDGSIKGAGATEYTRLLRVQGCSIGYNAHIEHAVWNASHFTRIEWVGNICKNLRGSGTGGYRSIFENGSSTGDQQIMVQDSYFETNWADNQGGVFRHVQKPGSVGVSNITVVDSGLTTNAAFTTAARLLATATVADPKTLYLTRNILGATRVAVENHTVYSSGHPTPVKPTGAGNGNWFSAYEAYGMTNAQGAVIINENGGPGGNGYPNRWIYNAANGWVADEFYRTEDIWVDLDGATLVAADSGRVISNEGATAEANFVLPTAAAGLVFTFICQDNSGIKATAAAGDTIRVAASVTGAAGNISTTTIGNAVQLIAINATEWIAVQTVGTWTVSA